MKSCVFHPAVFVHSSFISALSYFTLQRTRTSNPKAESGH